MYGAMSTNCVRGDDCVADCMRSLISSCEAVDAAGSGCPFGNGAGDQGSDVANQLGFDGA